MSNSHSRIDTHCHQFLPEAVQVPFIDTSTISTEKKTAAIVVQNETRNGPWRHETYALVQVRATEEENRTIVP